MKRVGYLYDKVISEENIRQAILDACKTKKEHKEVKRVLNNIDQTIEYLQTNFHISGKYRHKKKVDESSGKERELIVPPYFPDQIIQHAITRIVEPYMLKKVANESFCSIKKRGTLKASQRVRKILKNKKNKYYVKFDIKKYFPSINRELMMKRIEEVIKDKQLLDTYREIVYSVPSGIPIGNYTSQMFSNMYLQPLDKLIRDTLKIKFARYADDVVLIGANKRKLAKAIIVIKDYLKNHLNLETHENECVENILNKPIDFCGYKHYTNRVTIRKRIWRRARRSALRLEQTFELHRARRLMSYWGYIKHSNSRFIKKNFLNVIYETRQRLRTI